MVKTNTIKHKYHGKTLNVHKEKSYGLMAFLLGIALTIIPFSFSFFANEGLFMYMGDFDAQQMAFYQHIHDMVLSGNFMWDPVTDLGANIIGSYSFYMIGSPFFWLTLPFPSSFVPYLLGPILMLKFGCASYTGYLFLSRYVSDKKFALIGGLLYSFSSYAITNEFYNHFHDVIVVFPLLLYALDEYMYKDRKGIFAFSVCLSSLINYYFFAGQVIFVIIYWLIKVFSKQYKITLKKFLWLAFEAVGGLLMSAVILLPSVLSVLQNSRTSYNFSGYGWNTYFYKEVEKYPAILASFFFPADMQFYDNMFENANTDFASLGAWLPLFGMVGTIVFMRSNKSNWITRLLKVLIVFAFVPILNSAFQLFNPTPYFRWFYMITLILSLATVIALEKYDAREWEKSLLLNSAFTVIFGAICLFTSTKVKQEDGSEKIQVGVCSIPGIYIFLLVIAVISLLLMAYLIYYINKYGIKKAGNTIIYFVCIVAIAYNTYSVQVSQAGSSYFLPVFKESLIDKSESLNLDISDGARTDLYQSHENTAMFYNLPNMSTFHSIVPGSIEEFYESIGAPRNVGAHCGAQNYGIQGFLSTKYLITSVTKDSPKEEYERLLACFSDDSQKEAFYSNGKTVVDGWNFMKTVNGLDIYENENYVSMGFYYNSYITQEEYEKIPEENRHFIYCKALILSKEQAEKYGSNLEHLDINSLKYTYKEYQDNCKNLNKNTCNDFKYGQNSFSASINTSKKELVVFSVPYESGWSANINGSPANIEKVNNGFMAIEVLPGENNIEFTYITPGLNIGIIISAISFITILCYIVCMKHFSKSNTSHAKKYKIKEGI